MGKVETITSDLSRPDAVIINVDVNKLCNNPYRDLGCFPIDMVKIKSLVESIEKTGYWPSIMARPKDNMVNGVEVTQAQLEAMITSGEHDFSEQEWEIPFGHHRLVACKTFKYSTIPVIIRVMTNEEMLIMMANENKEGYGNNVLATLETIREVHKKIVETLECDTFADYVAGGNSLFKDESTFKNAKAKDSVSWKKVQTFLGSTWNQGQVRAPYNALKAINKGFLEASDYGAIKTLGHAENLSGMCCYLYEGGLNAEGKLDPTVNAPDWPLICKRTVMAACIKKCSSDLAPNIASLKDAYRQLRTTGTNPLDRLKDHTTTKPFDSAEIAKGLLLDRPKEIISTTEKDADDNFVRLAPDYEGVLSANMAIIEGVKNDPDWQLCENLEEIIKKMTDLANKRAKAVTKAAPKPPETPEGEDDDGINKDSDAPATPPADGTPPAGGPIGADPTLPSTMITSYVEQGQNLCESIAAIGGSTEAKAGMATHIMGLKQSELILTDMITMVLTVYPQGHAMIKEIYANVAKALTEPVAEAVVEPVDPEPVDVDKPEIVEADEVSAEEVITD